VSVVAGVQVHVGAEGIAVPGAGVIEEVSDCNPARYGGVDQRELGQEGVDRDVEGQSVSSETRRQTVVAVNVSQREPIWKNVSAVT
jgi:hypothetical protein